MQLFLYELMLFSQKPKASHNFNNFTTFVYNIEAIPHVITYKLAYMIGTWPLSNHANSKATLVCMRIHSPKHALKLCMNIYMWGCSLVYTFRINFPIMSLNFVYSTYLCILSYFLRDLGVFIWPSSTMQTTIDIMSTFHYYIIIYWNAKYATIMCFITMKTTIMCCLHSSMVIEFERKVNTKFYDDRYAEDIPWGFALEMGLGTCTWNSALHTNKSQVCKSYLNGLLRLRSWDFASGLGFVHMGGTWNLGSHVNQP